MNMSVFQSMKKGGQPICKYVDVCVQMYHLIIPIPPLDGSTKVERCEGMCKCVNVKCESVKCEE